tara:strand:+ start:709 stop:1365 length:657 start_codon:yes stop_codon:yes gene_type:complete
MIYEERRITLKNGTFADYRAFVLQELWPHLIESGHEPLCLLNGLIGAGVEDVVLIIGFENYDAWQQAQPAIAGSDSEQAPRAWIQEEAAKLLLASQYRPDGPTKPEDQRPVYGARRWWINPEDWESFNRLSYEGVWPAMDHMGHHVIGQFRDAATTSPLEILNLAGYHDPAHWQSTRNPAEQGVSKELVDKLRAQGPKRGDLVLKSYVCLMKAHWPED